VSHASLGESRAPATAATSIIVLAGTAGPRTAGRPAGPGNDHVAARAHHPVRPPAPVDAPGAVAAQIAGSSGASIEGQPHRAAATPRSARGRKPCSGSARAGGGGSNGPVVLGVPARLTAMRGQATAAPYIAPRGDAGARTGPAWLPSARRPNTCKERTSCRPSRPACRFRWPTWSTRSAPARRYLLAARTTGKEAHIRVPISAEPVILHDPALSGRRAASAAKMAYLIPTGSCPLCGAFRGRPARSRPGRWRRSSAGRRWW
jgi:hypothetical protein